jgi:hypothetical protein
MEGSGQLNAPADTHTEKEPGTHWVESCVGPIVDLDVWKKWKIPPRNSTSNRPDGNQVTIPTAVSCLTEDSSYPETLSSSPVDQPKPYSSRSPRYSARNYLVISIWHADLNLWKSGNNALGQCHYQFQALSLLACSFFMKDDKRTVSIRHCFKLQNNLTSCTCFRINLYTGHTQKNGAVSIVNTIETAPLFCVYTV